MANALPPISSVSGNRKPRIECEFRDVDLDDYTSIQLRVRLEDGTLLVKDAEIDDADAGTFHFEWDDGDLVEGFHTAEIVFTDSSGLPETWPADAPLDLVVRSEV